MSSAWVKAIIESALAGDERAGKLLRHMSALDGTRLTDELAELVNEKLTAQYPDEEDMA